MLIRTRVLPGWLAVGLVCSLSFSVQADWSENFDGGFQNSWVLFSIDGLGGVNTSPTFSAGVVNDQLVMNDTVDANSGGAVTGVALIPEPFTDVRMTAEYNPNNNMGQNDSSFLVARGDTTNNTFYSLEISYLNSNLIIWRSDGLGVGTELANTPLGLINYTDSLYVEFDVEGSNLDARAYDMLGGTLLGSANATDSTFTAPGPSGVIINSQAGPFLPLYGSFDNISATAIVSTANGDFNGDGMFDCLDVDGLVADIAAMNNTASYDMTGEGTVDGDDLDAWLAAAGAVNNANGNPYLFGDADLNGSVDVSDFNVWNNNKFSMTAAWCSGDFNADGSVDVGDFNLWNNNKFLSSDATNAVPEPGSLSLVLLGLGCLLMRRRK